MKTLLLIGLVALCGCGVSYAPDTSSKIGGSTLFVSFDHEGHQYLASYRGGLIHSESCTNHVFDPNSIRLINRGVFTK